MYVFISCHSAVLDFLAFRPSRRSFWEKNIAVCNTKGWFSAIAWPCSAYTTPACTLKWALWPPHGLSMTLLTYSKVVQVKFDARKQVKDICFIVACENRRIFHGLLLALPKCSLAYVIISKLHAHCNKVACENRQIFCLLLCAASISEGTLYLWGFIIQKQTWL